MPYQMKPSAKWIIAGLTIGHLSMFLLFLLDLLYLLGVLPQRLIPLSRDQWVALGFLFLLLTLIGWLAAAHYTYDDGSTIFPDQSRWQRRTLIGGWGGILTYTVLLFLLIMKQPDNFFLVQLELLPLICSGSFLISVAQSLRTIHCENRRTDAPHAD